MLKITKDNDLKMWRLQRDSFDRFGKMIKKKLMFV